MIVFVFLKPNRSFIYLFFSFTGVRTHEVLTHYI